jgi:hypothetical protein
MSNTKKMERKGSKAMKTFFRIEKAANEMLDDALEKLDKCIQNKKLKVKENDAA